MNNDLHNLLQLLQRLTTAGKAIWIRGPEPGFVFCFVGDERLTFSILGPGNDDNYISPEGDVHGVCARWRHRDLLFVQPAVTHPELMSLLRAATLDESRLAALNRQVNTAAFHALETL